MVFSHHWIDISGEKSYWWWVAFRIIVSAPVPVPFLWTLDFGFGTGLGLDNWKITMPVIMGDSINMSTYVLSRTGAEVN